MNVKSKMNINLEFFYAVTMRNIDDVKKYIKLGADVNCRDDVYFWDKTNIEFHMNKVFFSTGGTPSNYMRKCGRTALGFAVLTENYEMVKLLIENGADVNFATLRGWRHLQSDPESPKGITPLMDVADCRIDTFRYEEDSFEIAKILIENGANLELKDSEGETALFQTIHYPVHPEMFKLFIKCGADMNTINTKEQSIIMFLYDEIFIKKKSLFQETLEKKLVIIDFLIESGVDLSILNVSKEEFIKMIENKK